MRHLISSGSPYEPQVGFSRAVRVGNQIVVAGTGPIGQDGSTVGIGDLYTQTGRCLEIMVDAVVRAGGKPDDIVRTRIMLTDISLWQEAARAHGEVFGQIRPACTFVQVSAFIRPEWLVETEADAIVTN